MELATREKVAFYRRAASRLSPWPKVATLAALAGYSGALLLGNTLLGWYCFVVAVAGSFWVILLGIHTQEQEQTAALLEYMLEISEEHQSARRRSGA